MPPDWECTTCSAPANLAESSLSSTHYSGYFIICIADFRWPLDSLNIFPLLKFYKCSPGIVPI